MSILISTTEVGAGKIGYKNLFTTTGVTVTASTEAAGYEKENAYDWVGYDWWKPTAVGDSWLRASFVAGQTSDYMAIWGHNIGTSGASVKPQYSTNGGSTWNDAAAAVAPSDDSTLFFSFASVNAADWRVLVNAPTTIPFIGGAQIGDALTLAHNMDVGFSPPSLVPEIELKTARSESGAFIGGSRMSVGIKSSFKLTNLNPAWVRSNWIPFIDHAQIPRPFVLSWDSVTNPTEVVLAWTTKQIQRPSYSSSLQMDISLDFEGTL